MTEMMDRLRAMAGAWDSWMWLPLFPLSIWLGGKVARR